MTTAIVVGAGPNGLSGAIRLAQHGIDVTVLEAADVIGGGTRTSELTLPGLLHDDCSAAHPMALGSPFLSTLNLERFGLTWRLPEIDCAHPFDSGEAAELWRSIDTTAKGLGSDGRRWKALIGRPAAGFDELVDDIMAPVLHVPKHPLRLARFGPTALAPGSLITWLFRSESAKALLGGILLHGFQPMNRLLSSAAGLGILASGHHYGWPVAEGGSSAITDAMAAELVELGGTIETGVRVTRHQQVLDADIALFDLAPGAIAAILGDALPRRVAKAYRKFRHGPGAFKVDFAIEGGVPWTNEACGRAGTVHLGGSFDELAATESDIAGGTMPNRPFTLVGQQYLADPTRSVGDTHPLWTYAHVPNGYTGDATEAIEAQIERFAPGFRERILARAVRSTTEMSAYNPNYVGGDIMTGAKDPFQLVFGPRLTLDPYSTGVEGHFICSAATPPGPGAHGMCGFNAANAALDQAGIEPL